MLANSIITDLPTRASLDAARTDLVDGAKAWRTWWVLADNDVRQRYRRSLIGQFWMTISMGATILGIGLVFSIILKRSIQDYLPFLATGMIIWTFLSQSVNDLVAAFVSSD